MHSYILFPSLPSNSKLTDRRGGQSGKIIAVINIYEDYIKELNKLCGRIRIPKKTRQTKKKQARVSKIAIQKFTKELSVISAVSRGCRCCNFS